MLLQGGRDVVHTGQQQQWCCPGLCTAGRQAAVLTAPESSLSIQKGRRLRRGTLFEEHDEQTQQQFLPKPVQQQDSQRRPQKQPYAVKGVPRNLDSLLTSMITSCTGWQDLQGLVTTHQQSFKPIHTAAALSKLAKLTGSKTSNAGHATNEQLYRRGPYQRHQQQQQQPQQHVNSMQMLEVHNFVSSQLMPLLLAHVEDLGPRGLANSVWALSKLGVVPAPPEMLLLYHQLAAVVPDLEPQHISSVLYALAQWQQQQQQQHEVNLSTAVVRNTHRLAADIRQQNLNSRRQQQQQQQQRAHPSRPSTASAQPFATPQPLLDSLMSAAADKLPDFGPQALSNSLYAAALLRYSLSPSWLNQFWRASILQLAAAEQQHLSNMLYAAAVLQLDPPEPWRTSWLYHSSRSLDRATVQGLSNSVWAVAKLGWAAAALEPVDPASSSSSSSSNSSSSDRSSCSWLETFCSVSNGQLSRFSDQALSNCCWTMGSIAQQLEQQQQQQQRDLSPSLSGPRATLSALQLLLVESSWQQQLLLRLNPHTLLNFNPQQLSNTIWGLASIRSDLPKPWLDTYVGVLGPKLIQFKPQELSNIMVACARIRYKPGSSWMTLAELSLQRHMTCCDSQVISNVVWAMVQLQHEPSEGWLRSLLLEVQNRTAAGLAAAAAAGASTAADEGDRSSSRSSGDSSRIGYHFTPQGLSTLLLSMSRLAAIARSGSSSSKFTPAISSLCAVVCQQLLSDSSSGLSGFSSQGLAALAGAAVLCNQQDTGQQVLLAIMQELLQRQQQQQERSRPRLFQDSQGKHLPQEQQQQHVDLQTAADPHSSSMGSSSSVAVADVCMTLWAAARLELQPPLELMMPLLHSALKAVQLISHRYRLHRALFNSSSSARAAVGAAAAVEDAAVSSTINPNSPSSHSAAVLAAAWPGCKYLGALMYALGYLGFDPGSAWTRSWFTATEPLLYECSSWTLAMLLWGAVWLEVVPPSRWLRVWAAAWRDQRQQQQQQEWLVEASEGVQGYARQQERQQHNVVAVEVAAAAGRKGLEVTQQVVEGGLGLRQLRHVEGLRRLCSHLVKQRQYVWVEQLTQS